uniref:Uncharacterized protein n=1 Tax=Paenibacillus athensensis TaxID=1967502 RepID=A0A4Y8PXN4_9BACL
MAWQPAAPTELPAVPVKQIYTSEAAHCMSEAGSCAVRVPAEGCASESAIRVSEAPSRRWSGNPRR